MSPQALNGLGEELIRRRQRNPEEALPAGAVHRAGRDNDGSLLEHELRARRRGVAVRNGRPDVDRALRRRNLDADVPERLHNQVPAALVDPAHLLYLLARPTQRGCAGELDRLEEARVDVGLQAPVGLDRLGVAEDRRAAPAGHVVALGEGEDLDPDLLRARRRQEARGDVAVVGRLRVGVVVHDEDLVLAGELYDALEEALRYDGAGRIVRVVDEEQPGGFELVRRDRVEVRGETQVRAERQEMRLGAGQDRPPRVDGVARVGGERDVARVEEGEAEVVDALLRPDRGNDLRDGVDLDAEALQ